MRWIQSNDYSVFLFSFQKHTIAVVRRSCKSHCESPPLKIVSKRVNVYVYAIASVHVTIRTTNRMWLVCMSVSVERCAKEYRIFTENAATNELEWNERETSVWLCAQWIGFFSFQLAMNTESCPVQQIVFAQCAHKQTTTNNNRSEKQQKKNAK